MAILNMSDISPRLELGDAVVKADAYRLAQKRPVRRQVLLDGSYAETPLAVLPCTLVVEGRCLSTDDITLRQTLRTALNEQTAFDFTFDGMQFGQMVVREYALQKQDSQICYHISVTLCGTLAGEEMITV